MVVKIYITYILIHQIYDLCILLHIILTSNVSKSEIMKWDVSAPVCVIDCGIIDFIFLS